MRHPYKGIAQCVALRARSNFHGQLALGNGRRNGGHLFQVRHHIVERSGQRANFVVAMNVNVLVEVARVADLPRHGNQVPQRIRNGLSRVISDSHARKNGQERSEESHDRVDGRPARGGVRGLLERLADFAVDLVEHTRRRVHPRIGIFLQVKNLEVGGGGVTRVHLMAFGKHGPDKFIRPFLFGALYLNQSGAQRFISGFCFLPLQQIGELGDALVGLFFVAGVTAQEKAAEVQTVLHDLESNSLDGSHALQRIGSIRSRRAFAQDRGGVQEKQQEQNRQNGTKPDIELLTDCHCLFLHRSPAPVLRH